MEGGYHGKGCLSAWCCGHGVGCLSVWKVISSGVCQLRGVSWVGVSSSSSGVMERDVCQW